MGDIELSDDQRKVLQAIQENPHLVIFGCAASGKTTLAVETAKRLINRGKRVLCLCYSPRLANSIRKKFEDQEIYVADFRRFIQLLVQHQGIPGLVLPRLRWVNTKPWATTEEPGNYDLSLAVDYLFQFTNRFDAVIVDEGEKFPPGWWPVVETSLANRQKNPLYIFVDNNLMVYEFQANFNNPIYEAPINLRTNFRNAGPIFDLVQSLHPYSKEVHKLSIETGTVKEFIYSSEQSVYNALEEAFWTAEAVLSDLQNLVVISAENLPAPRGNLNGMVLDSPKLMKNRQPGRLEWQSAIAHYLKPLGFVAEELSSEKFPNGGDLRRIHRFCSDYKYRHKTYLSQQPKLLSRFRLNWKMDFYGNLRLHWEPPIDAHPGERDILDFFTGDWARNLPDPHRRYRLSIPEDYRVFPDYMNIRLVDSTYFRGHEAQAVIFVLLDYFTPYEYLLQREFYEAFSRARTLLYLVAPYSIQNKVESWQSDRLIDQ